MNQWLLFALLAPTFWGIVNVLDSTIRHRAIKDDMAYAWLGITLKLIIGFVFIGLFGFSWPSYAAGFGMLLAGLFWFFPIYFYLKALSKEETSRVIAIIQIIPVITLFLAGIFLNEILTSRQLFAFSLILLGSFMSAFRKTEHRWKVSDAIAYAVLAAFFWAVSDVIFKKFIGAFDEYFQAMAIFYIGVGLMAPLMMLLKGRGRILKHFKGLNLKWGLLIGLNQMFAELGLITFSFALSLDKISLTQVISGIQPLTAFIFGTILSFFFKKIHRESLAASSLLFKGLSLAIIVTGLYVLFV